MTTFGRYEILKRLAVGGMGEIYLARSASLDGFEKELVIKRILPSHSKDQRFVSMFIDEARVSMTLSHQNIIQVFDFGKAEGCYYLAMERLKGVDLTRLAKVLTPGLSLHIIREVLRGLDYAHRKTGKNGEPLSIVHRDISPENVMVSVDGEVKITDFGIANARGQLTEHAEGSVIGKLYYMAPEQAAGEPVDARTDVFGCGLLLWELLVGQRAYRGATENEILRDVVSARIEPPSTHNPEFSAEIESVLMRALSPKPEDRFESAQAFASAINTLLAKAHPDVDAFALAKVVRETLPESSAAPAPEEPSEKRAEPSPYAHMGMVEIAQIDLPEPVLELARAFDQEPSLWTILEIGAKAGEDKAALACNRVSAVKFAQHGLLAQSLLAAKRMLELDPGEERLEEVAKLPGLVGYPDGRVMPYLFRSGGPIEELLGTLLSRTLAHTVHSAEAPALLAKLTGRSFAQLAKDAPMGTFETDQAIINAGEAGDTIFLILSGRCLVPMDTPGGERRFIASLGPGDFFGEASFFSKSARNASVIAAEPTQVIEISQALYDRAIADNDEAAQLLLLLYKRRVVDSLLAGSPTFGLLGAQERKALVDSSELHSFEEGATLLKEGDTSRDIYLIKSGTAEAVSGGEKLEESGPGTIVGEVAALEGGAVSASVLAQSRVEALRIAWSELEPVLLATPELKAEIEKAIAERKPSSPLNKLLSLWPSA